MAYDRELAGRVRAALEDQPGVTEKPMFGTLVFMVDANMAVAVAQDGLMVRIGEHAMEDTPAQPHVRPATMGQRTMKGWVLVAADAALDDWIARGVAQARGLSGPS